MHGRLRTLQRVDFYRLTRPVQERFAAATRGTAPPAPLVFRAPRRTTAWLWLGASAALAVVTGVLLRAGAGNVESPVALHGVKMFVVIAVLLATTSYGVIHALAILRSLEVAPYRPGTYVFPACVVDANDPSFSVWPIADVQAVETVTAPAAGLSLRMRDGAHVAVSSGSLEEAKRTEAAIAASRQIVEQALVDEDPHRLAALDPLHDSAMSSPIGPTDPMRPVNPLWMRLDWAVAVVLGLALGLSLESARNAASDQAMFRTVTASASIPAYKMYLAQGGRRSGEIRDVLLPRTELRAAVAENTVEAIQAFAAAHPDTKVGPEIDLALRSALLAQLDKARKTGTVAALDDFTRRYPNSKLDAELAATRHSIYAQAFETWKRKAKPSTASSSFVERLLGWAEKSRSSVCEVRFRPLPSKTLFEADAKTQKSEHFPGVDALPSVYITANALHAREQRISQEVAEAFAANFASDILAMRPADSLGIDTPIPHGVPTLAIEYSPEWSHTTTASEKPLTVFANFNFPFDITFVLPDGSPPLKSSTRAWRTVELWRMKREGLSREDFQKEVYDWVLDGAFDQLDKRLMAILF